MNVSSVGMAEKTAVKNTSLTTAALEGSEQRKIMDSPQAAPAKNGNTELSVREVQQMVEDMQSQLDSMNISLRYSLYGENEMKVAVKVVNKDTGDVIREIPPKELQALQAKMSDLVGMIFDEKG